MTCLESSRNQQTLQQQLRQASEMQPQNDKPTCNRTADSVQRISSPPRHPRQKQPSHPSGSANAAPKRHPSANEPPKRPRQLPPHQRPCWSDAGWPATRPANPQPPTWPTPAQGRPGHKACGAALGLHNGAPRPNCPQRSARAARHQGHAHARAGIPSGRPTPRPPESRGPREGPWLPTPTAGGARCDHPDPRAPRRRRPPGPQRARALHHQRWPPAQQWHRRRHRARHECQP